MTKLNNGLINPDNTKKKQDDKSLHPKKQDDKSLHPKKQDDKSLHPKKKE